MKCTPCPRIKHFHDLEIPWTRLWKLHGKSIVANGRVLSINFMLCCACKSWGRVQKAAVRDSKRRKERGEGLSQQHKVLKDDCSTMWNKVSTLLRFLVLQIFGHIGSSSEATAKESRPPRIQIFYALPQTLILLTCRPRRGPRAFVLLSRQGARKLCCHTVRQCRCWCQGASRNCEGNFFACNQGNRLNPLHLGFRAAH